MNNRHSQESQTSDTLAVEPARGFPDQATSVQDNIGAQSVPSGLNHEERLAALRQAAVVGRNVLLLASSELLRCLAEMPPTLSSAQVQAWRKLLAEELMAFTRLCEQLNVRRDHMLAVRYALCTALDEAASLAPWNVAGDGAGVWANMALLTQFHGEREGGEVVFMLVGRLAHAPQEHMPVLEVIHHVLSLGFMGYFRTKPDGHRQLESIRHRLFTMVSGSREPVQRELSARWRGATEGRFRLLRTVPVWASASVLALVLFGQFAWAKYQLLSTSGDLEKRIHALRQLQPAEPVAVAQSLGLAQLLAPEIAKGVVTVNDEATRSLVVFKGDGMFAPGQSTLSASSRQTIEKVGQAIKAVPGRVVVTGHTDNQPPNDPMGLNQALSMGRAKQVAQVLQAQDVTPDRLDVQGKGAKEPLTSNDTEAGRAQNRRVAIEVLSASK